MKSVKLKAMTGLTVRVAPGDEESSFRRLVEAGDEFDAMSVPEWKGKVPQWLLDQGLVEIITAGPGSAIPVAPAEQE